MPTSPRNESNAKWFQARFLLVVMWKKRARSAAEKSERDESARQRYLELRLRGFKLRNRSGHARPQSLQSGRIEPRPLVAQQLRVTVFIAARKRSVHKAQSGRATPEVEGSVRQVLKYSWSTTGQKWRIRRRRRRKRRKREEEEREGGGGGGGAKRERL